MSTDICPCGTQKPYTACCEPAHRGKAAPASAADLMRARYSAFVKQEIDYLMTTVAPARRKEIERQEVEDWSKNSTWTGLEIIATDKGGPADETGSVEFIARFQDAEKTPREHHELATFVKHEGHWYFDDGRTPPQKPVRNEGPKVGRNDPCPCGSGKKYKKCHGAGVAA